MVTAGAEVVELRKWPHLVARSWSVPFFNRRVGALSLFSIHLVVEAQL